MIRLSNGNKKIGNDTLILNMTSATDCPSKALGLCEIENGKCYAMKAEKQYPNVLPYRRAQEEYWSKTNAQGISDDIIRHISRKKHDIHYIRISESGDFKDQSDVNKLFEVSTSVSLYDYIIFYAYTARRDLSFERRPGNMIINGSNFMVSNSFTAVRSTSPGDVTCPGDCRTCAMCKAENKLNIKVLYH